MGEKKKDGDGDSEKKDEKTPITVVLKVDMHCEGCASKIVRCVRGFEGVETVKADTDANKLTVNGVVDPSKIREKLQHKTKKKVDLISPQPKKDNNNNNSKDTTKQENNKKSDEKKAENDKKNKEAPVTTAVLKLGLHCHGCIEKIHKIVTKTKGVHEISIDKQKELVTVKGCMDVKALTESLKEKFKRPVEIVPPKKEKENGNGSENQAGGGNGGGKKKKGGGGGQDGGHEGGGGNQMERNKMEYMGQPEFGYGYGPVGYPVQLVHAPQTFNDENPNACYIM